MIDEISISNISLLFELKKSDLLAQSPKFHYILNNEIKSFVTVTDISDNPDELINGRSVPHIRYDADGVMVWNGKRCEATPTTD